MIAWIVTAFYVLGIAAAHVVRFSTPDGWRHNA